MRAGENVLVSDVHEKQLLREVVAVDEGFVYVSRPEEIRQARIDGREPNCIGFPLSDVVAVKSHK